MRITKTFLATIMMLFMISSVSAVNLIEGVVAENNYGTVALGNPVSQKIVGENDILFNKTGYDNHREYNILELRNPEYFVFETSPGETMNVTVAGFGNQTTEEIHYDFSNESTITQEYIQVQPTTDTENVVVIFEVSDGYESSNIIHQESVGVTFTTTLNNFVQKTTQLIDINLALWELILYVVYLLTVLGFIYLLVQFGINFYRAVERNFPQLFAGSEEQRKRRGRF